MANSPFLTQLDPRAKIKGSIDPLGFMAVWTRLGRHVIRNLTTVTTSVRGFTTLLLGLYFAEQHSEERSAADDQYVAAFLRFEQLAAYSRIACSPNADAYDEDEIRGILRVRSNLNANHGRVTISAAEKHQILSNQKTYGLWGLFMVAARNSGWLEPSQPRLMPEASAFIEQVYLPRLEKGGDTLAHYLERDGANFDPLGRDSQLAQHLSDVLTPALKASEQKYYSQHLLAGGEPGGLQAQLARHLRDVNQAGLADWSERIQYAELHEVKRRAEAAGQIQLAQRMQQIEHVEAVLSPAAQVLRFLLTRDGQAIPIFAAEVHTAWAGGLKHIDPAAFAEALASTGDALSLDARARLRQVAEALYEGDFGALIPLLLDHNRDVMQARGGAPWVRLGAGRLEVRFQGELGELPPRESLPDVWHPYFLNSLKRISYQIEGV